MLDSCSLMADLAGGMVGGEGGCGGEGIRQSFHLAITGDPLPIGFGISSIAVFTHSCVKP